MAYRLWLELITASRIFWGLFHDTWLLFWSFEVMLWFLNTKWIVPTASEYMEHSLQWRIGTSARTDAPSWNTIRDMDQSRSVFGRAIVNHFPLHPSESNHCHGKDKMRLRAIEDGRVVEGSCRRTEESPIIIVSMFRFQLLIELLPDRWTPSPVFFQILHYHST